MFSFFLKFFGPGELFRDSGSLSLFKQIEHISGLHLFNLRFEKYVYWWSLSTGDLY